ncbi:hypothetical protein AWB69_06075 [Caballeronia udeis]|uniref:Lipoprotein n=1 Tax=Caballeronia udeis TaxID=1232866 RepID=A0A158IIB4_9BURK|nr:hypothetical protein AWB69_06075 [Caballeronia udeis]
MRRIQFLAAWLSVISTVTIPIAAVSAESVVELKKIVINTDGNVCPITIKDPYHGRLTATRYVTNSLYKPGSHQGELFLQLSCISSDDTEQIKHMLSARYDERRQQWKRDVDGLLPVEQRTTHNFPVRAVNSEGFAVTYDAINGDPKMRSRAFAFCLRHPPVMLCGSSTQIARPYYKESDLLPFALTLVRSISFIDGPLKTN